MPPLKVLWLHNLYDGPDYFKLDLSREESGTNNHLLGPKTSAASERSSGRHTLSERKQNTGIVDCPHSSHKSLPEVKETKQEEERRGMVVVAINPPQIYVDPKTLFLENCEPEP
ncbi:hypothetical protein INR49_025346 [Caranx melampygus]|nr:hypothetical protein INR49_025346 [Caranx melampygus]